MAKSTTFFHNKEIIKINSNIIKKLKKAAIKDPFKRARFCLHRSHNDKVQEMIIVLHKDSYVRPHRHSNKSESFHIIEGNLTIIFFDDNGNIINQLNMGTLSNNQTFMYRLSSNLWHTVIPISEFVVFHETTGGPFIKEECEYANWAPDEEELDKIIKLRERIRACIKK